MPKSRIRKTERVQRWFEIACYQRADVFREAGRAMRTPGGQGLRGLQAGAGWCGSLHLAMPLLLLDLLPVLKGVHLIIILQHRACEL